VPRAAARIIVSKGKVAKISAVRVEEMCCNAKFNSATTTPNWTIPRSAMGNRSRRSSRPRRASSAGGNRQQKPIA